MNKPFKILDTTLREGSQCIGIDYSSDDMLHLAHLISAAGVDYLEVGNPMVTREIDQGIRSIVKAKREGTIEGIIVAHSLLSKENIDMVLDTGVDMIGVFFSVADRRLEKVRSIGNIDKAALLVSESIAYIRSKAPDILIRYTPEDTVRSEWDNVLKAVFAALEPPFKGSRGADVISCADTTGEMIPYSAKRDMAAYIANMRSSLAQKGYYPDIAVHCHNDRGVAVANALGGVKSGAAIVDVSVLGKGERAGIADHAQIKEHYYEMGGEGYDPLALDSLYREFSRITEIAIPDDYPIMGNNVYDHKAGIHSSAVVTDRPGETRSYNSVIPERYGRVAGLPLTSNSGRGVLKYYMAMLQIPQTGGLLDHLYERVKSEGASTGIAPSMLREWALSYQIYG